MPLQAHTSSEPSSCLIRVTMAEIFGSIFSSGAGPDAHTCQSGVHTLRFPVTSSLPKCRDLCSGWSQGLHTLGFHKKSMFSFQILFSLQSQNRPAERSRVPIRAEHERECQPCALLLLKWSKAEKRFPRGNTLLAKASWVIPGPGNHSDLLTDLSFVI